MINKNINILKKIVAISLLIALLIPTFIFAENNDNDVNTLLDISKATKAVEKAEKSMKDLDIALAQDAIILLADGTVKDGLNIRLDAAIKILKLEKLIAKFILYSTDENKITLISSMKEANEAVDKLQNSPIKSKYIIRINVIDKIKLAVIAIEEFKTTGEKTESAEEAIFNVSDKKSKTELEKKLKAIITQKELDKNIEEAKNSIEIAELNIVNNENLKENISFIKSAEEKIKKLPTGDIKKDLQSVLSELNKALKAKELLGNLEIKGINKTLTLKEIESAEKIILNVKIEYTGLIDERFKEIKALFGTNESERLLNDAKRLVDLASKTKIEKDILAAKKAIDLLKDEELKSQFLIKIKAIESYILAKKELENAEKNISALNINSTIKAFNLFKIEVEKLNSEDKNLYTLIIQDMKDRIAAIENYLKDEKENLEEAEAKIIELENQLTPEQDPTSTVILEAKMAIDKVNDKNIKLSLQKRLDAILLVKDAKLSVARLEAYPSEKSIKDSENLLNKIDNRYHLIIEDLGNRIAYIKRQMDIGKKIDEATNLVHKAITTRVQGDIIKAYFAVNSLKDLGETAKDSYERLDKLLKDLEFSTGNEASEETNAKEKAKEAIDKVFDIIDELNIYISNIVEGEKEEENKIKTAYKDIELAKNQIIKANAEVKKLKDQKDFLGRINFANGEIDLSEDNIDIKNAIMLVNTASKSVANAKTNEEKSKAKLDIAATRRAIDKIGHNNNKGIKLILLNNINAIETKLTSDNDEEFINIAMDAVNYASNLVVDAVKKGEVLEKQAEIDKAIFSAKISIGWVSDKNKAAKDTLNTYINNIVQIFISEKEGIVNSERINNAEKAVQDAENKKGSIELDSYIIVARLKVSIIKNNNPETDAKIKELTARLDILEGKNNGNPGGNSGNTGNTKPENNNNKPNSNTTTGGTTYPLSPLPNNERQTGVTEPKWGRTKELKKLIPTIKYY